MILCTHCISLVKTNILVPVIYKKGHHVNAHTTHKHTISSDSDDEVSGALKYPNESESPLTLSHPLTSASLSELDTNMSRNIEKDIHVHCKHDTLNKRKLSLWAFKFSSKGEKLDQNQLQKDENHSIDKI